MAWRPWVFGLSTLAVSGLWLFGGPGVRPAPQAKGMVRSAGRVKTGANTAELTLHYQGGGRGLPVPRIPGAERVAVPLYPSSRPAVKKLPFGIIQSIPGTPYVQIGTSRVYAVSQSSGTVQSAFEQIFARWGLKVVETGTTGGPKGTQGFQAYAKSPQSPLVYNLTYYSAAPGLTRYALYVTDIKEPPRPQDTVVPLDLTRVSGVINGKGFSSTNSSALKRLAKALDRFHTLDIGFHGCPAVTNTADLTLFAQGGRTFRVSVASRCSVSINGVPFLDYPAHPLWSAIEYAAHHG